MSKAANLPNLSAVHEANRLLEGKQNALPFRHQLARFVAHPLEPRQRFHEVEPFLKNIKIKNIIYHLFKTYSPSFYEIELWYNDIPSLK